MFNNSLPTVIGGAGCKNLTLSESELECCRPIRAQGGQRLRAFCPFHGSDHQRSLAVDVETGRFHCFGCGAWGYMDWSRRRWRKERGSVEQPRSFRRMNNEKAPPPRADLAEVLQDYQHSLARSRGAEYIRSRGIPLELAEQYGLGYAACGKWIHGARDWKCGRIVVPHTDVCGRLVNLYGRAIGSNESVPREMRHDHLPGPRGYFNTKVLRGPGPVFVTEGPFDALSLIAMGHACSIAVFGVVGWHWDWARAVTELFLALDTDAAGQKEWPKRARQARLRGKRVAILPPESFGGYKDVNEAWIAGALNLSA
jgi:DNA primase